MTQTEKPTITGYECRFATLVTSKTTQDDLHVIKEVVHYSDGTVKPNLRKIKNYVRDYYITQPGFRDHEDKKEWEQISRLRRYQSTQSQLLRNLSISLGKPSFRGSIRDLQESPYVYGTDISSTSLIKQSYKDKYNLSTGYTYAAFDTETDIVNEATKNHILMATISFKTQVWTYVQARFVKGYSNVEQRVRELANTYMGHVVQRRKCVLNVVVCDTEIDVVKKCIAKAHELQPDFLGIWNLPFDIERIQEACARAKVELEDLFSDPSIPKDYRYYKFIKGLANKTTASNKKMNFKPAQRWHTVLTPASFYLVDSMCVYRHVRQGSPEEPSYGLDAILTKHTDVKKVKFPQAAHLTGTAWHQFMQSNYPLEYICYNQFDCINMEVLDEQILDLQIQLPMFAQSTDFRRFNSQPKKTIDALHGFVLKRGWIMGCTSKEMTDDFDDETASLDGWIVMLPSHLVDQNGLKLIEENPNLRTCIRIHVADLDVAGSYPNGECVFNVSKRTTSKEIISIEGIDELTQRMQTINLSGGASNAIEICVHVMSLPDYEKILMAYDEEVEQLTCE